MSAPPGQGGSAYPPPRRLSFPADERRLPWLAILLDAYHSRCGDVLTPLRRYADEAFDRMLPFYGIKGKHERRKAVYEGRLHTRAKVLQELDWTKLAERMGVSRACGATRLAFQGPAVRVSRHR